MSIEKEVGKARRRLLFWRLFGEVFSLPQFILKAFAQLLLNLCSWLNRIEIAIFAMEQDAARRYILLTNLDPGTATGDPSRYAAPNPVNAELIQDAFMRQAMETEEDA